MQDYLDELRVRSQGHFLVLPRRRLGAAPNSTRGEGKIASAHFREPLTNEQGTVAKISSVLNICSSHGRLAHRAEFGGPNTARAGGGNQQDRRCAGPNRRRGIGPVQPVALRRRSGQTASAEFTFVQLQLQPSVHQHVLQSEGDVESEGRQWSSHSHPHHRTIFGRSEVSFVEVASLGGSNDGLAYDGKVPSAVGLLGRLMGLRGVRPVTHSGEPHFDENATGVLGQNRSLSFGGSRFPAFVIKRCGFKG